MVSSTTVFELQSIYLLKCPPPHIQKSFCHSSGNHVFVNNKLADFWMKKFEFDVIDQV